jgi:hypothetical protein
MVAGSKRDNWDNVNNIRHDASKHFRKKKTGYLNGKFNELATYTRTMNIRHLYRGMNGFKSGYQSRNNLVKDKNGELLPDSHNILNR